MGFRSAGFPNGSGYTHYKWRLDDGGWSAETPINIPILLTGLANGAHHVEVAGKRDSGFTRTHRNCAGQRRNTLPHLDGEYRHAGLRLNEVLARNRFILVTNGESPDLVELFNAGATMVDLSGKGLTDDPKTPSGSPFLPAPRSDRDSTWCCSPMLPSNPARNLGFGFGDNGETLYLVRLRRQRRRGLLDSVSFGPQLTDLSVGRLCGRNLGVVQADFWFGQYRSTIWERDHAQDQRMARVGAPTAPDDFLELYNPEPIPAAMGGLYLTDAPDGQPARHQVAPLSFIAANGYFAFKADGNTNSGPEHVNFTLAAEMGGIGLVRREPVADRPRGVWSANDGHFAGPHAERASTLAFFSTPRRARATRVRCRSMSPIITFNLMPYTQTWRFNQSNNLDGVNWTATNYNDSAWQSGQGWLAFENNTALTNFIKTVLLDPRTPPPGLVAGHAYYFRTPVVVTNDLTGFTLNATMRLDDCGVIYINGLEFSRPRMTDGVLSRTVVSVAEPLAPEPRQRSMKHSPSPFHLCTPAQTSSPWKFIKSARRVPTSSGAWC